MALSNSFDAVLTKHKQAVDSAAALEKATKVIAQIAKTVTEAGYASVDAFYTEIERIASGKAPTAVKIKGKAGKTSKAPKSDTPKATRKSSGPKKRFTDADREHWKAVYFGEAVSNLKETERILKKQGIKVSYQTLFNLAKAQKWSEKTPADKVG